MSSPNNFGKTGNKIQILLLGLKIQFGPIWPILIKTIIFQWLFALISALINWMLEMG